MKKKKKKKGFGFLIQRVKISSILKRYDHHHDAWGTRFLAHVKMQLPWVLSLKNNNRKHTKGRDVVSKGFLFNNIVMSPCWQSSTRGMSQVSKESRKHANFRTFLQWCWQFFPTKILCTSLHSISFVTKWQILPKNKMLVVSISKTNSSIGVALVMVVVLVRLMGGVGSEQKGRGSFDLCFSLVDFLPRNLISSVAKIFIHCLTKFKSHDLKICDFC
jgi:hypothetical protein